MSTQDMRKLSSVLRSIETIEEKTEAIHSQYITAVNENEHLLIDDSNIHLQVFFQHLEQLLQIDFKTRASLLNTNNNKKSYWNFFSAALKESKGLYETVLYVLNSQEVKTPIGRGRLFLRFCLQNHRLGDVIQQAFMMPKVVSQFYIDECFWMTPAYLGRIMEALYQLNEVQFDLLSSSQYQLDICWPTLELTETRPKTLSDAASRLRNNSVSSFISMNSVDSQSIISNIPDHSSPSLLISASSFQPTESSTHDGSPTPSLSSIEEDPENTLHYWKEKCQQLEVQCEPVQTHEAEVQCLIDHQPAKEDVACQWENEELVNEIKDEKRELSAQVDVLTEEVKNLKFQLSSTTMENSTSNDKLKNYERHLIECQALLKSKEALLQELQGKIDEHTNHVQSIRNEHSIQDREQQNRIQALERDLEKAMKALDEERLSMEKERDEYRAVQDQMEATVQEKTLDFEEMKRRLIKAIREKAELFNSVHSYEIKLEEEQTKKWIADEEVTNCTKCDILFGWTVRKHHCRHCQKIFCYYCSNNWVAGPKTGSPQARVCDYCYEKLLKESLMPTGSVRSEFFSNPDANTDDVDLRFEVRAERLSATTDTSTTS